MSLAVDWSKVNPPVTEEEQEKSVFSIGVTLAVLGIAKLETMADLHELLLRARFYEQLYGPIIQNNQGKSLATTKAFWDRWAGVSINGTKETRAAWIKRMVNQAINEIDYKLSQEL